MSELVLRNRQREQPVNVPLLRQLATHLLEERWTQRDYQLGILLVSPKAMARLNQAYLGHAGPTDVIAFDHRGPNQEGLYGEIYLCVAVAVEQAPKFKTTWQNELVRYMIHGILHLRGYDDLEPELRRKMKRQEALALKALAGEFKLELLHRRPQN